MTEQKCNRRLSSAPAGRLSLPALTGSGAGDDHATGHYVFVIAAARVEPA